MKITEFDRNEVDALCSDIETALAQVANKYEVRISLIKTTYRTNQCTLTLEAMTLSPVGEANTREAEAFKIAAEFFGLKPEHLGQTFRDEDGLRFRLVGLNIKARKRPFIIADVTGKQYSTSEEVILRGFGIAPRKDDGPTRTA